MTSVIVVRVRATVGVRRDIKETMELIGLNRPNHAVVVPLTDSYKGMLQKIKDYCTWGEADAATLEALINARGKAVGDVQVDDAYVAAHSSFGTVAGLAQALAEGDAKVKDVEGMKPVFRLHPPVKGYEGNKHAYAEGGALGYRGAAIADLVGRMI